jgi:hypothetical protein
MHNDAAVAVDNHADAIAGAPGEFGHVAAEHTLVRANFRLTLAAARKADRHLNEAAGARILD